MAKRILNVRRPIMGMPMLTHFVPNTNRMVNVRVVAITF